MIKALLFDKDATLLDFEKTWGAWSLTFLTDLAAGDDALFHRLAAAVGFDPERVDFAAGSPVIAGTPEESTKLLLPLLPEWSFEALLDHSNAFARDVEVHPIAPLAPVLGALKQHAALGIATNDSAAAAQRHMTSLGVEAYFDAILGSDSGFRGKPGPGMCLAFAEQVGLPVEQIAMVGDSTHDLEAGRAAGMVCVGVTSGYADEGTLSALADFVFPDVTHLPAWLADRSE
ncbi:MAG: HAD family hydrolase [Litoreibacter sp.]|nr:HAD family hydrolase [Litoreibacter sp.]MCY4336730.1 HAD family hydrolase [Litoreibacter sp.]